MATCSGCGHNKDAWEFVSERGEVTKTCEGCRARGRQKYKAHYDKNAEKEIKRIKGWRARNPDVHKRAKLERDARYAKNNAQIKKRQRKRYLKRYPEKNVARVQAYNARKLRATPAWADKRAIADVYAAAELLRKTTGKKVQVDHIVPLRSSNVCGLHAPANLRIVVEGYNARKSNKAWPDMW